MKKLIINKIQRITKNRKRLEEKLNLKIKNRGKEIFIEGGAEDEFVAEKILDALDFGFPFSVAMLIKEEDFEFEVINIKDYTNRKNLTQIRARIIGAKGRSFRTLNSLTNCYFEIQDNSVGIIGEPEAIKNAQEAIIQIIQGTKHGNVYSRLEKNHHKEIIDLGLKKFNKNQTSSAGLEPTT